MIGAGQNSFPMKTKTIFYLVISLFFLYFTLDVSAQSSAGLDENTFGEIKARHIGPAAMSGRISAIDAVDKDPRIVFVGAASGGIWKSKNAGTTFSAVFDDHCQSIGAITIDQKHPDTVWAGTGEIWTRNSVSIGDGIYRSTDGGDKWENRGLKETERIARIIIHPEDPDVVYVAAMGHLWDPNAERGVFVTRDAGATWEKILYVDENTGCSDLAMDPGNPDILYAGMWDYRRQPHYFRSGGPGSGLYTSRDGGKTWNKVTAGMPDGTLGRVALAVSPANPRIVWALVEADKTALLRSADRGLSWETVSTEPVVGERPFYFAYIYPDPVDTNRLYKPGFSLNVSDDGGKTFMSPYVGGGNVHSDLHALYIPGNDNNFIYCGTDGGLYLSHDRGNTWKYMRNLPVSQFYRISVDRKKPYNVYGGLQDNGSWYAPTKSPAGINNRDWENVGYGDGFNVLPDPFDPDILYWQYQGGQIKRFYNDTREFKDIKPFADQSTEELRFNWNTPLVFGPASNALYVGSQYLFRSSNRGDTWERISPDLTTDDPAKQEQEETGGLTIDNSSAENHCTIYTIGESPLDADIIWVGTDDGNLQLTTDGGKNWTNVTQAIPGLPQATWCSYICPGNFDKGTVYVVFDGHRTGDMTPYVYKSTDLGKSWVSLANESIEVFCISIREDIVDPELVFLGTEFGMYVSIDAGNTWTRFKGEIPKVPIHEMVIHPDQHDLVIGTHGRGILIVDDITPLRSLKPEKLDEELVFLGSRPYELGYLGGEQRMDGDDEFTGSNPPYSAYIHYYLKKRHIFGDMYLEIYDEKDSLIKTLPAGKRKGINRVVFFLQMDPPRVPSSVQLLGQAMSGPTYPPGDYRVKIVKGEDTYDSQLKIVWDPSSRHSAADRDMRHQKLMEAYYLLEDLAYIDRQVMDIRDQARKLALETGKGSLRRSLEELAEKMENWHGEIVPLRVGRITGEKRLRERLGDIYGGILGYQGRPTDSQVERLDFVEMEVSEIDSRVRGFVSADLPGLNAKLAKEDLPPIKVIGRAEFMKEK